MYATTNFKTKKAFREAVMAGEEIPLWQPGPYYGHPIPDGRHSVEGPWAPEPHKWYANVVTQDGKVISVK